MMKKTNKGTKKGFTLIELLVVIAIIAILAVVVVLTLNPAEMMRRARDSNRASDLGMIKTAISLYLSDVSTTNMGTAGTCYVAYSGATAPTTVAEFPSSTTGSAVTAGTATTTGYALSGGTGCSQWFNSSTAAATTSNSRSVSNGWIPINLTNISSGAPIAQWPVDPAYGAGTPGGAGNLNAGHFYSYITGSSNSYKIAAKMESVIYSYGGSGDLESTDGGVDPYMYEQGTSMSL